MDRFKATTEGLQNSLALTLLPVLTALFDAISRIPVPVLKTLVVLGGVVTSIVLAVKAIKSLTDTGKTITNFFKNFDTSSLKTTAIIIGIVAALIALATVITVLTGKSQELQNASKSITDSVQGVTDTITGTRDKVNKAANNATGVAEFAGGKTWVGEAGPELVTLPKGTKIETESRRQAAWRRTTSM